MKISLNELTHEFEGSNLFDKLSFSFEEGTFYFLKGSSGCGKSTLLKMIVNLLKPDSGLIDFSENLDVLELTQKVQLLPQLPVIIPGSVKANLLFSLSIIQISQELLFRKSIVRSLAALLSGRRFSGEGC